MMPTALLMLKALAEGGVKTRLGREIGVVAATRAYRRLVEHQLREIPAEWRTHICYAPANAEAAMRTWLGEAHRYSAQASGDLGKGLAQATEAHFPRSVEPLIILGGIVLISTPDGCETRQRRWPRSRRCSFRRAMEATA